MTEEQTIPAPFIKPKRKKFLPVISIIVFLCIVWYWYWNRIVSDVKIFSPPEWVWLEGKTELMVIPGKDELLIHKSKQKEPHYKKSQVYIDNLKASRRLSKFHSGDDIKSEYFYQYVPNSKNIIEVNSTAWNTSLGIVTTFDTKHYPQHIYLKNNRIGYEGYTKITNKLVSKGKIIARMLSPFVLECSQIPIKHQENPSVVYQQCIEDYLNKGIDLPQNSLAVILSAKQNINLDFNIMPLPFPMGGGGRQVWSSRQHYHQLLSLEDSSRIGNPVRTPMVTNMNGAIPKPGKDRFNGMGWSYDGRFVVYTGMTSFCIVEIDKQANP